MLALGGCTGHGAPCPPQPLGPGLSTGVVGVGVGEGEWNSAPSFTECLLPIKTLSKTFSLSSHCG